MDRIASGFPCTLLGARKSRSPTDAMTLHRPGQHDAADAPVLHAAGRALRSRARLLRRAVSDLDAARVARATLRPAVVHDEDHGPKHIPIGQVYRDASPYVVFGLLMPILFILLPPLANELPRVLLRN